MVMRDSLVLAQGLHAVSLSIVVGCHCFGIWPGFGLAWLLVCLMQEGNPAAEIFCVGVVGSSVAICHPNPQFDCCWLDLFNIGQAKTKINFHQHLLCETFCLLHHLFYSINHSTPSITTSQDHIHHA